MILGGGRVRGPCCWKRRFAAAADHGLDHPAAGTGIVRKYAGGTLQAVPSCIKIVAGMGCLRQLLNCGPVASEVIEPGTNVAGGGSMHVQH